MSRPAGRHLGVVTLCSVALTAGCVLPDDISRMQKDVADVQQQMRRVESTQAELAQQLEELLRRAAEGGENASREDIADLALRVEQFSRTASVTSERLTDLEQRVERYSQELQRGTDATRPPPGSLGVTPPGEPGGAVPLDPSSASVPDPEALFNTAYADFSKGNYALAVSGFQEYQERFPRSPLADNALYWIAECRFSEGDWAGAVEALDDLLERYPDTDRAAAANLKKALAFQEQNQIQPAILQYRYVVAEFPGSDEARLARDKLSGLGTSPQ